LQLPNSSLKISVSRALGLRQAPGNFPSPYLAHYRLVENDNFIIMISDDIWIALGVNRILGIGASLWDRLEMES
jgi:hypothetical protein